MMKSILFYLAIVATFIIPFRTQAVADSPGAERLNAFVVKQVKELIETNQKSADFTHKDWGTRNPFEGYVSGNFVSSNSVVAAVPAANVDLQGIFLGGQKSSAIIEGTVVGVGDTIKGWTVKEIKEGSVVVADTSGREQSLTMKVDLSSHADSPNKSTSKLPVMPPLPLANSSSQVSPGVNSPKVNSMANKNKAPMKIVSDDGPKFGTITQVIPKKPQTQPPSTN